MEEKIVSVIDLVATLISQVESGTSHVIIRKRSSVKDKDKPLQKVPEILYMMLMCLAAMTKQNIRNISIKLGSTRVRIVNASRDDAKAYDVISSYLNEWLTYKPGTSMIKLSSKVENLDNKQKESVLLK